MKSFIYKGKYTQEISFPLGGIGSGSVGLAGNGRLIDWEIFNRPNKQSEFGFSHFAIKAESNGKLVDARVLNGDIYPPYTGTGEGRFTGFGKGVSMYTLAGFPHFKSTKFIGEFPIAKVIYLDAKFPGEVGLTAFNPFVPTNIADSSIPAAFFEFEIKNNMSMTLDYTIGLTIRHPYQICNSNCNFHNVNNVKGLQLSSEGIKSDSIDYGDVSIATDSLSVSYQQNWFRGNWFEPQSIYWKDFTGTGKLKNRFYEKKQKPPKLYTFDYSTLASHIRIKPKQSQKVRFVISWYFPNSRNYWKSDSTDKTYQWNNYYSKLFEDSYNAAVYSFNNFDNLFNQTTKFKDLLFKSSLPKDIIEAISANISILKSPTCLLLDNGTFYGWEGCNQHTGSCEGSCTHVWNYAYALPFLFPKLERSMREADYKYNIDKIGKMDFRLQLPLGSGKSNYHPCVDGQFGGVIKAYRDWKISGDSKWLKTLWPYIKRSIEYAWHKDNIYRWDPDKKGLITGRQHHTLDKELFGPNSWLSGFYVLALKAASEIAEYFNDPDKAKEYNEVYQNGKNYLNKNLFNGEYYFQKINLKDKSILDNFADIWEYWSDEHKQIILQIGDGCMVDQVVSQWHSNLCGLGEIFDRPQVKQSLKSIYKYNFKVMRDFTNFCRIYSLNDEKGVVICSYPKSKKEPLVSAPYAQETMSGFEYQVACHMIQEGMIQEGLEIVKAIRGRYDGYKRNPWNEFECGSNYARSMASYSLLLAFSGFQYDMVKGVIGFNPIHSEKKKFNCFWSLDSGWGNFMLTPKKVSLQVDYGSLKLNGILLPFLNNKDIKYVKFMNKKIRFKIINKTIIFDMPLSIKTNERLLIHLSI